MSPKPVVCIQFFSCWRGYTLNADGVPWACMLILCPYQKELSILLEAEKRLLLSSFYLENGELGGEKLDHNITQFNKSDLKMLISQTKDFSFNILYI